MSRNNMKVSIDIQIDLLDTVINYLFTQSPHINRKSLLSIRKFFDCLETKEYETNEEMYARIYFIKEVLKIKLDSNIYNPAMIYEMVRGGSHDEEIEFIIDAIENGYELNSDEVRGINSYISERLKYMHLYMYSQEITDQMERLQIGNFESLADINSEVKESIGNLLADMRKAESDDMSQNMFDLTDDIFESVISDVVTDLQRPSNYLKTGIKYLNQMYNGGYEAGRVYMYIGPSGGFKSGILLSSMRWMREYNKDIEVRDPNKKPCVIYITQENSMKETIERLFNLCVGPEDIRNYTPQQVMQLLRSKGGLDLDTNPVQLKMFYFPNKSISTDDLYGIIDEVEEEGLEVVGLVHDYIKRIRPANPTKDLRIDLGNIVDEFTVKHL